MAKKQKLPGEERLKEPKRELFCWLYAGYHNRNLFGNGTRCYMQAFGFNDEIGKLQKEIDVLIDKKEKGYTVGVNLRERRIKSRERVATTTASDILTKPDIRARCSFLMSALFKNEFMDEELAYTAGQRYDLASKIAAIREFNRLKGRVEEKVDANVTYRWADPEGEPVKKKK